MTDRPRIRESVIRSRGPIVRTDQAQQIVRIVDIDGLETEMTMRFLRDISWLRETTTTWRSCVGQRLIKEGSTYNDYYGFLTSYEDPLEEAKAFAAELALDATSALVVEAATTIVERPVIPPPTWALPDSASIYRNTPHHLPVPKDWIRDNAKVEAWLAIPEDNWDARHEARPDYIAREERITEVVIWSSARTEEENAKALADMLAAWTPSAEASS